jgi:uncharacterized repeat protein (TIGR03803 family)
MKKLTFFFGFLFIGIITQAQYTVLLNFNGTNGAFPKGSLTISGSTLYGMTNEWLGASTYSNVGNIFSIQTNGSGVNDLINFSGNSFPQGSNPFGNLTLSNGVLYGMTSDGGANSYGVIFTLDTNGSGYSDMIDFSGIGGLNPGENPEGSLTLSVTGDTLFGMTSGGGANGDGVIFSYYPVGNTFTPLVSFTGTTGSYLGANPTGSLTLSVTGDTLFGMTLNGGANGDGVIFSYNWKTNNYTDMVDFSGTVNPDSGANPIGSLTLVGKVLYGMTSSGGKYNYGCIFSLNSNGSSYKDLLSFNGINGYTPYGSLTFSRGMLFGMTGGGPSAYIFTGNLFSITTNATNFTNILNFTGNIGSYPGLLPSGDLTLSVTGDTLFAMTPAGGVYGDGVIFSYNLLYVSVTNVTCDGGITGVATIYPSYGVPHYTYIWSPGGSTNQTITGLSAGTYTITVTDNRGATATSIAIITQPNALSVSANMHLYASCITGNTGSALATAYGGTSPYTYSWSNGERNSLNTGLAEGTYTVTVTDSCGATATASAMVWDTNTFLSVSPRDTTLCSGSPFSITYTASIGGSSYLWSNGVIGSTLTVNSNTITTDTIFWVTSTSLLGFGYGACVEIDTVKITLLPAAAPPIIDSLTSDSISFFVTNVTSGVNYVWTLSEGTSSYCGIGDTAYLPIWPQNATLIYYADSGTACQTTDTVFILHKIAIPSSNKPYPRWSKRGMYMDWCPDYDLSVSGGGTNITQVVSYCRDNHIYYVALNDLLQGDVSDYVFDTTDEFTNPGEAPALAQFIDSLKTRGGVEEVGLCSSPHVGSVYDYASVADYNSGKPWNQKIDILSMDEEFETNWNGIVPDLAEAYTYSLLDFHGTHMPNLINMSATSHGCPHDYLRVEDFIETPLDPWGDSTNNTSYIDDTALYQLKIGKMELDSIDIFTDRIILSSYTLWPNVLWNEGDFIQVDSEFGSNPNHFLPFYNKEIWPAFDPANSSTDACAYCIDEYGAEDLLGDSMCKEGVNPVNMEQRYFDSLSTSENSSPRIFTNNLDGAYAQHNMGNDTAFQILGCIWFMYGIESGVPLNQGGCVQNWTFDTTAVYTHPDTTIPFYVTVGHDSEYINYGISTPPITVTATVHGGKPPYSYTWYDLEKGTILLYSTTGNTYTTGFNVLLNGYPVSKLGVVVRDKGDTNVTDYLCIYEKYTGHQTARPFRRTINPGTQPVTDNIEYPANSVKVYPNPNKGQFTARLTVANVQSAVMEIYNIMGERVLSETLRYTQGNNTVNLSNQPNGIYFYRVLSDNGNLLGSGKVIIEK